MSQRAEALAEASGMLVASGIKYEPADITLLAEDIAGVAEEYDGDVHAATRELMRRIGGLNNLDAYMECLR